ncbi:MAG: hypothetical protein EKK48_11375 [Candidatus Melainabacteria bacterium]|nr:MAG: hypothetical protein EKK48_11375 [Candidatus Melainabacteria bacterium]
MSAVPKPSLSDPLSLDGLEPLLDQIFAPAVQNEFAPGISTFERTNDLQSNRLQATSHATSHSTLFETESVSDLNVTSTSRQSHVDFYVAEVGSADSARNELLSKQLTELKEELKEFQFQYRQLQLELATKEDQLQYLPELFSKVLSLTAVEAENAELRKENAALLQTIEHLTPKPNKPSMGRRIINRFFGA